MARLYLSHTLVISLLIYTSQGASQALQDNTFIQKLPPTQQQKLNDTMWQSSLDSNALLKQQHTFSVYVEVRADQLGNQQISSYPQLNLQTEKPLSLSFERHKPRIKFRAGGLQTAIKLRGDGVKVQFNPVNKNIPLNIELKITDDDSSLRLDYRF